jgi:uncharacterized protein YhaN
MLDQSNGSPAVDLALAQARTLQQLGEEHQKLLEAVQQLSAERDRLQQQFAKAVAEGEQYRKSLEYFLRKEYELTPEQLAAEVAEIQRNPADVEEIYRLIESLEREAHD